MSVSDSPLLSDATTEAITEQDENRQPECLLSRTPLTEIDIPHTLILPMPMQHLIGFHTPSAIMHFGQTIQGTLNNKSRSHRVSMNWMICPRMMTFHQQSNFLLHYMVKTLFNTPTKTNRVKSHTRKNIIRLHQLC